MKEAGQDVKARAKGDGCVVEIAFDSPAEAVAMAERLFAPNARAVA